MNDLIVLPIGNEENLCPHYESPEQDPVGSCLVDFLELGSRGDCWKSHLGHIKGFICPFTD